MRACSPNLPRAVDDKKPKKGDQTVQAIKNKCQLAADKARVPIDFLSITKDENLGITGTIIGKAEALEADLLVVGGAGQTSEQAGEVNLQVRERNLSN